MFLHSPLSWALDDQFIGKRMSFIAGPRQVGKTTAIENFFSQITQPKLYYNWDTPSVKKNFAKDTTFFLKDIPIELKKPWVAFDEIHKYPKWKNLLKGYYDEYKNQMRFIITGSAKLDLFRKSGDSLVGRYFLYQMLPLGWRDVLKRTCDPNKTWHPQEPLESIPQSNPEVYDTLQSLLQLTGFPEPFYSGSHDFYTRWQEEYIALVVKEDLRDLTKIVELQKLHTLLYLLPERVGSPLSIYNLSQSLENSHPSVKQWLQALELVYLIFPLSPWSKNLARSVLKEQKWYFWDWGMIENPGVRFENFMALMLKRAISAWNEWGKGPYDLYYLRTKDGAEVDFVIANKKRPLCLIEIKLSDETISTNLLKFKEKLGVPYAFQVVNKVGVAREVGKNNYVMSIDRFLQLIPC